MCVCGEGRLQLVKSWQESAASFMSKKASLSAVLDFLWGHLYTRQCQFSSKEGSLSFPCLLCSASAAEDAKKCQKQAFFKKFAFIEIMYSMQTDSCVSQPVHTTMCSERRDGKHLSLTWGHIWPAFSHYDVCSVPNSSFLTAVDSSCKTQGGLFLSYPTVACKAVLFHLRSRCWFCVAYSGLLCTDGLAFLLSQKFPHLFRFPLLKC